MENRIKHGRTTIIGVKEKEDGSLCCEQCGNQDDLRMISHVDYTDRHESTCLCEECGNHIYISTKRTKAERKLWEE